MKKYNNSYQEGVHHTSQRSHQHIEIFDAALCSYALTLKVLVATIDAQWEGMGGCRVGEVRAGTTSPMPDHKGFELQ